MKKTLVWTVAILLAAAFVWPMAVSKWKDLTTVENPGGDAGNGTASEVRGAADNAKSKFKLKVVEVLPKSGTAATGPWSEPIQLDGNLASFVRLVPPGIHMEFDTDGTRCNYKVRGNILLKFNGAKWIEAPKDENGGYAYGDNNRSVRFASELNTSVKIYMQIEESPDIPVETEIEEDSTPPPSDSSESEMDNSESPTLPEVVAPSREGVVTA